MTASFPGLPDRIKELGELASDLWWSWHYRARDLFRRLDYTLWRSSAHNPVAMLRQIAPERLEAVSRDRAFLALYDDAVRDHRAARASRDSWWSHTHGEASKATIAYFSAEFALHQSLPIYAGGLGVLAGDFCKEASDLGMPFVGVGFMYPQGYFHQKVTADGWQEETYELLNWEDTPTRPAIHPDGSRCVVSVPLGTRTVHAAVWQVRAGKVRLFLLDTDIEQNAPWDRGLSARLYGGNQELRLQQEIVLGLGGVRAIKAMGIEPTVWHLNEGHAAFVALQRIWDHIEQGASFDAALEQVRASTVFTTHTPVPAGHDAFPFPLVETHMAGAWGSLGEYRERFMALGAHDSGMGSQFNMTALAMRHGLRRQRGEPVARRGDAEHVSRPSGRTRRKSACRSRPSPTACTPTRGSPPTWASCSTSFSAPTGATAIDEPEFWDRVLDIPDQELWNVRLAMRHDLLPLHPGSRTRALDHLECQRRPGGRASARCSTRRP